MAELAGASTFPAYQLPVGKDACADTLRHIDDNQVLRGIAVAEPYLRQGAGVGHIVYHHRESSRLLDACFQLPDGPVDVRGEDRFCKPRIEAAGQTHPDAFKAMIAMGGNHGSNCGDDCADDPSRF